MAEGQNEGAESSEFLLLEAAGSRHSLGAGSGFTKPLTGLGWERP